MKKLIRLLRNEILYLIHARYLIYIYEFLHINRILSWEYVVKDIEKWFPCTTPIGTFTLNHLMMQAFLLKS